MRKGIFLVLPVSPSPKSDTAQYLLVTYWPVISPIGKSECIGVRTKLPQLWGLLPRKPISVSPHTETGERKEAERVADRLSEAIKGGWILLTAHRLHQEPH